MKKIIIAPALFALIFSFATHTMEPSWKQMIKFDIQAVCYKPTTMLIDIALGIRQIVQKTVQSRQPDIFIKAHRYKLKKIENDLREKQHNQINMVLKENGLNDEQIEKSYNTLKIFHDIRKEILCQPNPNTERCPQLEDSIIIIRKQLAEKNMNIESISVVKSNFPKETFSNGTHTAEAQDTAFSLNPLTINKPATITFFPHAIGKPHIKGITIHEAEHIIEGHCTTKGLINQIIPVLTNHDIYPTINLCSLERTYEQQAEIFPSLRNAHSATTMRDMRHSVLYPNMLYGEHYLQLSEIDETHKMIAYLEHVKKSPQLQLTSPCIQPQRWHKSFAQ